MQRILVVDDDPAVRNFLRRGFTLEGFQVGLATTGEEGLAFAHEAAPDVVILDLMMPGIGGLETLRRFKLAPTPPPVVMLTGRDDTDEQKALLQAGADGLMVKPVRFADLLEQVRRLLRVTG